MDETRIEKVDFNFRVGERFEKCRGVGWIPDKQDSRAPCALLLHGLPSFGGLVRLGVELAYSGFPAFTFHYPGAWQKDGCFTLEDALEGVHAAIAKIQVGGFSIKREDLLLIGHSMGGTLALLAATNHSGMPVAALAPFNFGRHIKDIEAALPELVEPYNASPEAILEEVQRNPDRWDLTRAAAELRENPVLLIGGEHDTEVPTLKHHDPIARAFLVAKAEHFRERIIHGAGHQFDETRLVDRTTMSTIIHWMRLLQNRY